MIYEINRNKPVLTVCGVKFRGKIYIMITRPPSRHMAPNQTPNPRATEVATRTLQTSGQHLGLRPGGRHRPPRAQIKRQLLTASPPRPGTRNQLECPARGPAPALRCEAGQCAKRQRAHTGQRPVRSGTEGVRRSPARPRKRLPGGRLHLTFRTVVAPQPENPEPTHGHTLFKARGPP